MQRLRLLVSFASLGAAAACGSAVDQTDARDEGDGVESAPAGAGVPSETVPAPSAAAQSVPVVAGSSSVLVLDMPEPDPIFEYPELAPGVTSVVQPSFFSDPTDANPEVTFIPSGEQSSGLEGGSGDLTVLLVFDKSSSMLFGWDGQTRWQVANESLRAALDPFLDVLTIGVIRFPLQEQCTVPAFDSGEQIDFTSGREFVRLWQEMEHRLESLGTPLGAALVAADRAIELARSDGRLEGRFRVVLVTDGEPNCGASIDAMTGLVAAWYGQGVETMVIGLPGSDVAAHLLDALAQAGGTGVATMTETREQLDEAFAAAAQ